MHLQVKFTQNERNNVFRSKQTTINVSLKLLDIKTLKER